jgi:hypothetical protein
MQQHFIELLKVWAEVRSSNIEALFTIYNRESNQIAADKPIYIKNIIDSHLPEEELWSLVRGEKDNRNFNLTETQKQKLEQHNI